MMLRRDRLQCVLQNMNRMGLRQLIVSDSGALQYLLGEHLDAMERCGVLLIRSDDQVHAFMNQLFCFPEIDGIQLHTYRDGQDVYAMIAGHLLSGEVGIDRSWPSGHLMALLARRADIQAVSGSDAVDGAMACKDQKEQELLLAAGAVNDKAMAFGIENIRPDRTEQELAQLIDDFFIVSGGTQVGQYQIACYGANAAQPHHMPDSTRLRPGNAILLDLVCPIDGYWCDMTRTVFYKEVSARHRKVYEVVRTAQQAGIDFVRPGVRMCDIDRAVRSVIENAGYGDAYITRTGHGIGTHIHEPPQVSNDCTVIAQPGMVFSIEPGIYIPNDIGVRIEDLVLVTEKGCQVLTNYPKELQIVR